MTRMRGNWLLLLLAIVPAMVPLVLIALYGVGFAFWDEWDPGIAGLYIKAHNHQFHVADLFAFHNEHRIAVPRLIFLIVNSITRWNCVALMVLSWFVVMATSTMVLRLLGKTLGANDQLAQMFRPRVLFLWFLMNVLIFTPAQWENWLWGMGVQNFLPMMWIISGLMLAYRPVLKKRHFAAVALMAILATYSSGNGLLAWPMLGGVLAWSASWKELNAKKWQLLSFAGVGLIILTCYFWGFRQQTSQDAQPHSLNLIAIAKYIGIFLGAIICNGSTFSPYTTAYGVSCVLVALLLLAIGYFGLLLKKSDDPASCRRLALWLCIAGFGLLSAVLAGLARAGSGPIQAFSSRYVTFSLYLPAALVPLFAIISDDIQRRFAFKRAGIYLARVSSAIVSCMLVMHVLSIPEQLFAVKDVQYSRRQGKAAILFSRIFPENTWIERVVFPRPAQILPMLDRFEEMHWIDRRVTSNDARLLFATPGQPIGAKGHLDGTYQVDDKTLGTQGWAVLSDRPSVSDGVVLTYDNEAGDPIMFAYAGDRIYRDDVARSLENVDLRYAGWEAVYPASALPSSLKTVKIRAWAVDAELGKIAPLEGLWTLPR